MKRTAIIFIVLSVLVQILGACANKSREEKEAERMRDEAEIMLAAELEEIEKRGNWKEDTYVDEFGASSGNRFYLGEFEGQFSNSATNGSKLKVRLLVDQDSTVRISLYEYGDNLVKAQGNRMKVRRNNDEIYEEFLYINDRGYGHLTDHDVNNNLKKDGRYLFNGGKLEFSITESGAYGVPSRYQFVIEDASGINDAIKKLNRK